MTTRTRRKLLLVQWASLALLLAGVGVNARIGAWPAAILCGVGVGMALTLAVITHATEPRR